MRKAFIILLVVVSPIAFVLYLLPNTEKYFQKWMSMFWKLLLVFPTVSLLFGAGQLASAIVLVAGTNKTTDIASTSSTTQSSYSDTSGKCIELPKSVPTTSSKSGDSNGNPASIKDCGAGSTPVMLGLVAAGIAIAPLLAVWSVLKGALSAAGAIGGKIGGAIQSGGAGLNKYTRKPEDAFRKGLFNAYKARALRGDKVGIGGRTTRFIQRRKMAGERRENELKAAEAGFALHDPRAGKISEQNINAQQQANAAHIAEMQKYARSGLAGSDNYLGAAGSDAAVVSALASQKKRASEELIKAYNEALSTTDIADKPGQAGLQSQLRQAFIDRNDDLVKAIVDELSKSSRGRKAIRAETAGFEEGSHYDTVVRQRIQTNSPGAKNSDAALKNWVDGGGGTYGSNWDSQATWQAKVDNLEKFVAMDGDAQNQAWSQFSREHRGMLKKAMDASPESLSRVDLALKEKDVWNDHT